MNLPNRIAVVSGIGLFVCIVQLPAASVREAWISRYNGPDNRGDWASAVAVDRQGNVVVTGYSENISGIGVMCTRKYEADSGRVVWEQRYANPNGQWALGKAVAVDSAGNVIVTGSAGTSPASGDIYTAKYHAATGTVIWEKRYNGVANGNDYGTSVAVDGADDVVITGDSRGQRGYDYYTAKYSGTDGALRWETRRSNADGSARVVLTDAQKNVVVAGDCWNGKNADLCVIKYSGTDGAALWERKYDGPGHGADYAYDAAVDADSNVIVTGMSAGLSGGDYLTAKYAAGDGALLWSAREDPGGGLDEALAVAVDYNGNVLVTGSSETGGDYGVYTVKYDGSNGTVLWAVRSDDTAQSGDRGYDVAVDSGGNAVVAGVSSSGNTAFALRTWKYATQDGAQIWEARYGEGSTVLQLAPNCLGIGPGNEVVVCSTSGSSSKADVLAVRYEEPPTITWLQGSSAWQLEFLASPGREYDVCRAPGVNGPWTVLGTAMAPENGYLVYTDDRAPEEAAFYRLGPR